jgi:hypothetical protein
MNYSFFVNFLGNEVSKETHEEKKRRMGHEGNFIMCSIQIEALEMIALRFNV